MGIKDLNKKYDLNEIVKGDSIFCATGITSNELVNGVKLENGKFITETLVTHKNSTIKNSKKRGTYYLINSFIYNKRSKFGPFVYRLGHVVFILERGVRFP